MKIAIPFLLAALTLATLGCGKSTNSSTNSSQQSNFGIPDPVAPATPPSLNKADYPVFPDADAGADPAVSADQGGKGFTGAGWQTNTDFDFIGDPRALKGGRFSRLHPRLSGELPQSQAQDSNSSLSTALA